MGLRETEHRNCRKKLQVRQHLERKPINVSYEGRFIRPEIEHNLFIWAATKMVEDDEQNKGNRDFTDRMKSNPQIPINFPPIFSPSHRQFTMANLPINGWKLIAELTKDTALKKSYSESLGCWLVSKNHSHLP